MKKNLTVLHNLIPNYYSKYFQKIAREFDENIAAVGYDAAMEKLKKVHAESGHKWVDWYAIFLEAWQHRWVMLNTFEDHRTLINYELGSRLFNGEVKDLEQEVIKPILQNPIRDAHSVYGDMEDEALSLIIQKQAEQIKSFKKKGA